MTRAKVTRDKQRTLLSPVAVQRDNVNTLEQWVRFAAGDLDLSADDIGNLLFAALRNTGQRALETSAIEELRRWLLAGFNKIIDEGEWVIRSSELGEFYIVIGQVGTTYEEFSAQGHALHGISVAKLLDKESWRLARCAWCGKTFMRRKRGEYCGPECSQKRQTFKSRNKKRWEGVVRGAEAAKQPIATYLLAQRKKPERYVTTCPVCQHEFEVPELPMSAQCPSHKRYFIAGPLNSKTIGLKGEV